MSYLPFRVTTKYIASPKTFEALRKFLMNNKINHEIPTSDF
jgi:hypothetical protein